MAKITKQILQNKIQELESELKIKNDSIATSKKEHEEEIIEFKKKHDELFGAKEKEYQDKTLELENKIKELESQDKEKQKQLDFQETKKLAKAYEDQKDEYGDKARYWSWALAGAVSILVVYIVLTTIFLHGKSWQDKIEFYAIDIILFSAVWFCVSQYSYYTKLYADFANRQALAQSYANIINNTEDAPIKDKFLDKTTDILCSPNNIDHKDNLPVEKILNNTFEIAKNLSKTKPNISL